MRKTNETFNGLFYTLLYSKTSVKRSESFPLSKEQRLDPQKHLQCR